MKTLFEQQMYQDDFFIDEEDRIVINNWLYDNDVDPYINMNLYLLAYRVKIEGDDRIFGLVFTLSNDYRGIKYDLTLNDEYGYHIWDVHTNRFAAFEDLSCRNAIKSMLFYEQNEIFIPDDLIDDMHERGMKFVDKQKHK